ISRNFNKSHSLPETLKSIRDEIIMTGTVGRFQADKLELLSLSKPPVLIKRQGNKNVMALPGSTTGQANTIPEKFLNIRMSRGDTLIFYTPSILDLKNPAGEKMGIGRFSRTFNAAASGKAKEIAAGIVRLIQIFSENEKISTPFQLLIIKHR
ncbi:MAG: SpoIIE family protein phosphatase, partial [Spirochaetaceae bacterium]|nr:SpoIIE family protein phosphatase [Spirochaetaceae bacterium]